ncbi:transposon Ty3-I Gag-Pol polyprotein [Trichonephila clavipes]|nr:transposon Ty3-I Gag-Pol polyprotein [Trichonephila clavipes]
MVTSGSSFTPTSLSRDDNVEVGQPPRALAFQIGKQFPTTIRKSSCWRISFSNYRHQCSSSFDFREKEKKGNSIQLSATNTSPINVYDVKHNVKHFVETTGLPVFVEARRLAPDRLKIVKSEFQLMLNLGHIRPSKSNYASTLYIVPKKDSNDYRPKADYRGLNAQTKTDKYSIPKILDFTSELYNKFIFSQKDLLKLTTKFP